MWMGGGCEGCRERMWLKVVLWKTGFRRLLVFSGKWDVGSATDVVEWKNWQG
jgi:hypothetical protein